MALKNTSALLAALLAAAPALSFAQTATPAPEAPATEAPATEAAAPEATATETPATETPAADAPATEAPAQTPATEATAAEAPAAQAPEAVPASSIAASAEAAQPGQAYEKETFGDWQMRCLKTELEADPCELFQELKNQQGTAISQVTFSAVEAKDVTAIATVMMPLETDLLQGLTMQIDTGKEQKIPFATCVPMGCMARIALTDADLTLFKRGNAAKMSVVPFLAPPEAKENVSLSLSGFTAGMDAVTAQNKKAAAAAKAAAPAEAADAPKN